MNDVQIKAKTRKWGSSLGVIIPKEQVDQLKLSKDQEVVLKISHSNPLTDLFGTFKDKGLRSDLQKLRAESDSRYV